MLQKRTVVPLRMFFKISDKYPHPFSMCVSLPRRPEAVNIVLLHADRFLNKQPLASLKFRIEKQKSVQNSVTHPCIA